MPKEGQNKMSSTNHYKQMKVPYVVYTEFECVLRKNHICEPDKKQSSTVKTEKHEPCGFSYLVVRRDGQTFDPFKYRGEDAGRYGKQKAFGDDTRRLAKTQECNRMPHL